MKTEAAIAANILAHRLMRNSAEVSKLSLRQLVPKLPGRPLIKDLRRALAAVIVAVKISSR